MVTILLKTISLEVLSVKWWLFGTSLSVLNDGELAIQISNVFCFFCTFIFKKSVLFKLLSGIMVPFIIFPFISFSIQLHFSNYFPWAFEIHWQKHYFWNSICVHQRAIHHFEYIDNSRLNTPRVMLSCKISLFMSDQCKCIWNCYFIIITEIGLFHAVSVWNGDYRSLVHSFLHKWDSPRYITMF